MWMRAVTVEDQLREICSASRIDLLFFPARMASGLRASSGRSRNGSDEARRRSATMAGFYNDGGVEYQVTSVPIDQADERIASLSVGEPLDFKAFNTPVALLHQNKVIESSLPGVAIAELDEALRTCPPAAIAR